MLHAISLKSPMPLAQALITVLKPKNLGLQFLIAREFAAAIAGRVWSCRGLSDCGLLVSHFGLRVFALRKLLISTGFNLNPLHQHY